MRNGEWWRVRLTLLGAAAALSAGLFAGCEQATSDSPGDAPVAQATEASTSAQVCVSIRRAGAAGTVFDAAISSKLEVGPSGGSATMNTGYAPAPYDNQILLQFDLSALPSGGNVNITSAAVNLARGPFAPSAQSAVEVHNVLAPWSEATVTWASFNGQYDPTVLTTFSNGFSPANLYPSFGLSGLVQGWVRGTTPNHGVLLRDPLHNLTNLWTSEYANFYSRPQLNVCYTVSCLAGTADCNGNGADGCETNLTTSAASCGACGNACSVPNAAPACVNSVCQVGSCNLGFGNCDGLQANGCETLLTTSANCGGCGVACSRPNGTASCATGTCALTACSAGFFDCDGNPGNGCEALPCGNGQHCATGPQCASGVCNGGFCAAPSCTDGIKNEDESAIDCGGSVCPPCATGHTCGTASDCQTHVCTAGVCQAASCTDGVKNGSETSADCGGGACPACPSGLGCALGSDCQSGVCTAGGCQAPVCNDGLKNGNETSVDCGGSCAPCSSGKTCLVGGDCVDQICAGGVCQLANCTDAVKNGAETGVDCGGACPPCNPGQPCTDGADCQSGVCKSGLCQAASCGDGVKNGNETGVDCGGACFKPEACNGVDDDCNGLVDDGLGSTTCGVGACQVSVQNCVNGVTQTCVPGAPGVEICDGLIDDDCDGVVDNGCACVDGQTQSCYTGAPSTLGVGVCQSGVQTCVAGQWGACAGEITPSVESCDGLDNDCNGQVDDGLGQTVCGIGACQVTTPNCLNGLPQACAPRAPGVETCDGIDNDCNGLVDDDLPVITCGVGACRNTVPSCVNGQAQTCVPGAPGPEVCDGIDNDCDGTIDNGNPGGGASCPTGNPGVCAAGTTACAGGHLACNQNVQPSAETCDGLDNDCNGALDDGNPGGGIACNSGHPGICAAGATVCSGGQLACQQLQQPQAEACNGLDDDCDGVVDNGDPGGGAACSTGLLGVCAAGTTACAAGQLACHQSVQPGAQLCNGLDENCDGAVDEGCTCLNGTTQPCYSGAAATLDVGVCHGGTQTCSGGNWGACVGQALPGVETCDGLDNDCNGQVDDGLGTLSCGVGQCGRTVAACVEGKAGTCTPGAPSAETCDGLDNDCDGVVDNGNPGGGAACSTGLLGVCAAGTTACTAGALACNQNTGAGAETCDGLDNDCNGVVDDGLPVLHCGVGQCAVTTPSCLGRVPQPCVPGAPAAETCNGLDDDCDGVVDDGNPGGGAACSTGLLGVCAAGTTACTSGKLACNQNVQPSAQQCNGLDDDCNGVTDEGCTCLNGATQPCYSGAPATQHVGACHDGVQTCAGGQWGACVGEALPGAETCDGLDNDCNGQVDEGLGTLSCGVGQCGRTVAACVNGQAQTCVPGAPSVETCDGLDNDCDGVVDNGNPGAEQACSTGHLGVCAAGTTACVAGHLACNQNVQPSAETCDGLDNDCDGAIDNGNPGGNQACSTGHLGVCAAGTTVCSSGQLSCSQNVQPSAETCDGLDNDCDGVADNGNPGGNQACSTGAQGVCSAGTTACSAGHLACNQNVQPSAQLCNGLDENCNGVVDEGCTCLNGTTQACYSGAAGTQNVGVCRGGTQTCAGGNWGACVGQVLPSAETCDGLDNNCNGQVDDGLGTLSCGVGQCGRTVAACAGGHANTCNPGAPSAETCDGLDNDCDGVVDNGNPGGNQACSTGLLGVCAAGLTLCQSGALTCVQQRSSSPETCDGLDNNCNGQVDDGLGSTTCGSAGCTVTVQNCVAGVAQACQVSQVNGQTCSDGNACTQTDTCQAGVCTGGNAVVCAASDQCHSVGTCNPSTGACTNPTKTNGTSCSDGNACTSGDVCTSGTCGGATVAAGTSCGAAQVCNGTACSSGCYISGAFYASGTANPANACQTCAPATSTTAWSNLGNGASCNDGNACTSGDVCTSGTCGGATVAAGTSCGAALVCNGTACSSGCYISGAFYASGAINAANACQVCTPATSTTAWSSVINGTSCSDGNACTSSDVCTSGTCGGSTVAAGTSCGAALVCNGTACSSGCYISGAFYASGAVNPANACLKCTPATSTTAWSNATNGTSCSDGNACTSSDQCTNGTCGGATVAAGTSCGTALVCNGTACSSGCYISGTFYASGAVNAANTCQSCLPGTSTTAWTTLGNGTSCSDGNACTSSDQCTSGVCGGATVAAGTSCGTALVCNGTACSSGCYISGTYYASGTVNTANACQSCIPGTSTTAWSNAVGLTLCSSACVSLSNDPRNCGACGHSCVTGQVCSSGSCTGSFASAQIAVGAQFACAVQAGTVQCWGGYNAGYGALGNGTTTGSLTRVPVTGVTDATAVFAASFNACALRATGGVVCWGQNADGQLGDGTTTGRTTPVAVVGLTNAVAVSGATDPTGANSFTCAVRSTGTVSCWGDNTFGQLGNGTTTSSSTPVTVTGLSNATAIGVGNRFACALKSDGTVACWGNATAGALGNGQSTGNFTTPVAVTGVTGAVGIAAAYQAACAVKSSGAVACWGNNNQGQLGNGTTTSSLTPVTVSGLNNATAITACDGSSVTTVCTATTAGGAVCWGNNTSGQIGNGTTTTSLVPAAVTGLTGAVQTAVGGGAGTGQASACSLLSTGTIVCWGSNSFGALGNNSLTSSTSPVTVQ
jgi:hypothetical protein